MKGITIKLTCKILALTIICAITACTSGCFSLKAKNYGDLVLKYAKLYDLEEDFLFALIYAESEFKVDAISSKGAQGLMQLMPSTAKFIAKKCGYKGQIDLFSVDCNLTLGCEYIKYLQTKFSDERSLLCAYNAGEGVVSEWLKNAKYSLDGKTLTTIPYKETKNYLRKISFYKLKYKRYLQRCL